MRGRYGGSVYKPRRLGPKDLTLRGGQPFGDCLRRVGRDLSRDKAGVGAACTVKS